MTYLHNKLEIRPSYSFLGFCFKRWAANAHNTSPWCLITTKNTQYTTPDHTVNRKYPSYSPSSYVISPQNQHPTGDPNTNKPHPRDDCQKWSTIRIKQTEIKIIIEIISNGKTSILAPTMMIMCVVFPSSCKEYKTALDDFAKASNTGGDETPVVTRYRGFMLKCLRSQGWKVTKHHYNKTLIGYVIYTRYIKCSRTDFRGCVISMVGDFLFVFTCKSTINKARRN